MKLLKRTLLITAVLLLSACGKSAPNIENLPAVKEEAPVRMEAERHWTYSASAETEDASLIQAVKEAIGSLKTGKESRQSTDDYTDIISFVYADGTQSRYEFEADCWVAEDGKRYEIEGDLSKVRTLIEPLFAKNNP